MPVDGDRRDASAKALRGRTTSGRPGRSAKAATHRTDAAMLDRRVRDLDAQHCPASGGSMRMVPAIVDRPAVVTVLVCVGLPTELLRRTRSRDGCRA